MFIMEDDITKMPKRHDFETFEEYMKELLNGDDLHYNKSGANAPNKKRTIEQLFKNTLSEIQNTSDDHLHSTMIYPLIRHIMSNILANEIIGIQPAGGPISQIHTLRVRYAQEITPEQIAEYYNGKSSISSPTLEVMNGNRLSIQILKEVVETKQTLFKNKWKTDVDCISPDSMMKFATDLIEEIDQSHLASLAEIAGKPHDVFDMSTIEGTPTFVGDVHAALAVLINRNTSLIASRTRRGHGNWVVVSPTALTILQSATTSAFARVGEGTRDLSLPNLGTPYVGKLLNCINVYCNILASDDTPVLIGYKGNDIDAAAYYVPYKPVLRDAKASYIDPKSFAQFHAFKSQHAFLSLTNSASCVGNTADYLAQVGIDTTNLTFI